MLVGFKKWITTIKHPNSGLIRDVLSDVLTLGVQYPKGENCFGVDLVW